MGSRSLAMTRSDPSGSASSHPSSSSSSSPSFFLHRRPLLPLIFLLLLISGILPPASWASVSSRDENGNSVGHELAAYDNEIINEPVIECGPGIVHFRVDTRKGNASAVYVRGQSQNADCTFHNTRNVTIELAKCNVRRKREVNPNPGIAYQMTLVVQLHPLFVTKVDRAYNVNCFYREHKQDVSVDFGVNDLVTQQMLSHAILPNCTYSVHRDSPNGPRVKYTHVGEQLYHVWDCPSRMYAMLLYNCNAVDGTGAEHPIVDADGCSRDEFLMPQITYTEDRTRATAASSAFNFPDRNTMLFTCKIKLCMLSDTECSNITPPNCNGKRAKIGGGTGPNGNFNVDTAGGGERARGTTARPEEATEAAEATTRSAGRGAARTEVSGEVAEPASTTRADEEEETTTTTTSTTTTTTTSYGSTTTKEQLLGSEERAASVEQQQRGNAGGHAAGSSSATPGSGANNTNHGEVPADFPRPGLLLQRDQPKAEEAEDQADEEEEAQKRKERMQRLAEAEDGSWTLGASTEEEAEEAAEQRQEHFRGTTKPVKVFNKKTEEGSGRRGGEQAGRSQRDTPRAGARMQQHRMAAVDFDIQSPELLIMDDYEPAAAAQKGPPAAGNQRNSIQEAPFVLDWGQQPSSVPGARASASGVCFSPAALICAGALLLALVLAVTVALAKAMATRKSSASLSQHSFYSR